MEHFNKHKIEIIDYIKKQYSPHAILLYGSFIDHSNNQNSDFDGLVISDFVEETIHDTSVVSDIQLDLFVYPTTIFDSAIHEENFVQIFDSEIILDERNIGGKLQNDVQHFISEKQNVSYRDKIGQLEWCKKMLKRSQRNDSEGYYRWHWLLVDSLEIYFNIMDWTYVGPKKSLSLLKQTDFTGYTLYSDALLSFETVKLSKWIEYMDEKLVKHVF